MNEISKALPEGGHNHLAERVELLETILEEVILELEDLEECGRSGREPRRAKSYRIVIDRIEKTVRQHEMSGRGILQLVDRTPDKYTLTEKLHGGARVRIEPDDIVVFHRHKVERFETAPKSAFNGDASLRNPLSEDDLEYLNASGYRWRLSPISVQGHLASAGHSLVLTGYRLPPVFKPSSVDLMVRIPALYPAVGLDMFNTYPAVSRIDGRILPCLTFFHFEGQNWQQWSRHRLPGNPWNPATDCLATHMALVENALANDAR